MVEFHGLEFARVVGLVIVFWFCLRYLGSGRAVVVLSLVILAYAIPDVALGIVWLLLWLYAKQVNLYRRLTHALRQSPHQSYGEHWQQVVLPLAVWKQILD